MLNFFSYGSLVAVLLVEGCKAYVEPLVKVEQGKLRGSIQYLPDGVAYYSFKGIPYARPPVGELRFQAPQPPSRWNGVREAIYHGAVCPHYDPNTNQIVNGSENCLFINVYTRSIQLFNNLPVMVYIHGGGFSSGSGNHDTYGPELLLQHNVVVVTMNYRLEVLGFLSLDTPEVPGNAGMKDQVLALKWVKENIDSFGGNPDNITIFGESAGAVAVTYHILSPMSKGLFHKAIAQSGVCIDDSGIATDAKDRAFRVGKLLGKETTDTPELLQFLRSVPANKLANMTVATETADEKLRGIPMRFGPVVEKTFDGIETFISEEPTEALVSSELNKVPLIIGYNNAEGLIMLADQLKKAERFNKNSSYLVPREILQKISSTKVTDFGKRILKFYTGNKGMGNDTVQGIVNMRTDMHFAYNIHRFAHLYSKFNVSVYFYRFDYATDLNIVKNFLGYKNMPGACHADDLFYVFLNDLNKKVYSSEKKLQQIVFDLTKLWTYFATTGDPNKEYPNSNLHEPTVKWSRYTATGQEYLALNEVMTASQRADAHRIDMWNQMYCDAALPCIRNSQLQNTIFEALLVKTK